MGRTRVDIFPKKTSRWLTRHMKTMSTSLIREIQIQVKMRYHLTPVRMAKINNTNKCWQGCRERGTLLYNWWKGKLVFSTLENSMDVSQNVKNRTTL